MENVLDLTNDGSLSLTDLDFDGVEEVQIQAASPIITPAVEETSSVTNETPLAPVEIPEIKLEDLEFEAAEGNEGSGAADNTSSSGYTKLDAVRAVLEAKFDRYEVSRDSLDLASMSEEELVDLEEQLDEAILDHKWGRIKQSDKNLDKLLTYIENGGDPTKISGLFHEQKEIEALDVSTASGQEALIKKYYKDVLGWDEEKVKNKLTRLQNLGGLEEEASDVKVEYDKHLEAKQGEALKKLEQRNIQQQYIKEQREAAFNKALQDNKIPKARQQALRDLAFNQGVIKGTGEKIDLIDHKILQVQADPNPMVYLELVEYLDSPEAFKAKIIKEAANVQTTASMSKEFKFNKSQNKAVEANTIKPSVSTPSQRPIFNFNK